jgi:hypothetical protein
MMCPLKTPLKFYGTVEITSSIIIMGIALKIRHYRNKMIKPDKPGTNVMIILRVFIVGKTTAFLTCNVKYFL